MSNLDHSVSKASTLTLAGSQLSFIFINFLELLKDTTRINEQDLYCVIKTYMKISFHFSVMTSDHLKTKVTKIPFQIIQTNKLLGTH